MKLENYENLTPCQFFEKPPVKRCLIRFIKQYGGGGASGSVTSFNGRTGVVTLTDSDVTTALGYTPVSSTPNLLIAATDSNGDIIDGAANVITRTLTGFSSTNSAITAADTILSAFGKTQGQMDTKIALTSPITGFAVGANSTVLATDTLLAALGKVQGQLNAKITTSTTFTGYVVGANTPLATTDNILTALGKIQGQINARALSSSVPTGADPTSQVSTTATNGVATTFMRSDAAPAINQGMSPVWTQPHHWTTNTGLGGEFIRSAHNNSNIAFYDNTNTTRSGYLQIRNTDGLIGTSLSTPFAIFTNGTNRLTFGAAGGWTIAGSEGTVGQAIVSNGVGTSPTYQDILLKADYKGGQSPFTADNSTTVFNITHNLGAIPSYFTLTTTEPISANHLNRTITFPDNNTLRITFAIAPLIGENANYVWIVYK